MACLEHHLGQVGHVWAVEDIRSATCISDAVFSPHCLLTCLDVTDIHSVFLWLTFSFILCWTKIMARTCLEVISDVSADRWQEETCSAYWAPPFLHHYFPSKLTNKQANKQTNKQANKPPKHLVWSTYIISTAIRTALKVAWRSRIRGKKNPVIKRKLNCFWNGTKRKIARLSLQLPLAD